MGKYRAGEIRDGTPFKKAAQHFLQEYTIITEGERNAKYVEGHGIRLRVHLLPFFGEKMVEEITPGVVQEYRVHRMTSRLDKEGKPKRPSRSTIHSEIITLRHVLKTAQRHGWLSYLPDISAPYKTSAKLRIARGFRLRNISSFTKPPANGRRTRKRSGGDRPVKTSTTMCCSW